MKTKYNIRLANEQDIHNILLVMDEAKKIMRSSGNLHQWSDGYPSADIIRHDIALGGGYVIEEAFRIVGYFALLPSPDPTYAVINNGKWLKESLPYHVIHRIAGVPNAHGIFQSTMDFCFQIDSNIRIDTHRNNTIMQHNLQKHGFTYCGIIYLENGDERLAYQKIKP